MNVRVLSVDEKRKKNCTIDEEKEIVELISLTWNLNDLINLHKINYRSHRRVLWNLKKL